MMSARILIVEDNPFNRRLIHDILEYRGHQILEAGSVDEGRELLRGPRPDLVVMDVQIPGGGGESLMREMKRDAALARVPVIAVTALAMHGDKERLLGAGFDGYLSKPIDVRRFGTDVESFLHS